MTRALNALFILIATSLTGFVFGTIYASSECQAQERPSQGALQLLHEHMLLTSGVTAMASVNKVLLLGNLGRDPEMRYTPNGTAICNMSIATNEAWKDAAGDKQERTEWHRIVCFGPVAENCGKYLEKGQPIFVEGSLRTRKWVDKDKVERYSTEIHAHNVKFLNGRAQSEEPAQEEMAY